MPEKTEIAQKRIDHFWDQFQQGRISGDHAEEKVFAETLRSFAQWHEEQLIVIEPCAHG